MPKKTKAELMPLTGSVSAEFAELSSVRQMLSQCTDIFSTKQVADAANALEIMARRAKMSAEAVQAALETKIVAYQKLGLMLKNVVKNKGNAGKGRQKKGEKIEKKEENPIKRIEEYGITRNESSQCQRIADLDSTEFALLRKGEISITKALRLHTQRLKEVKILATEVTIPGPKRKKLTFSSKIDKIKCDTLVINELLYKKSDDLKGIFKKINGCGATHIFLITYKDKEQTKILQVLSNYNYYDLVIWQDTKFRDVQIHRDANWIKSIRFVYMFSIKKNRQDLMIDRNVWREDFFSGSLSSLYYNLIRISTKSRQVVFDVFCDIDASGARAAMINKSKYYGYNNDEVKLKLTEQSLSKWFEQNESLK